MRVLTIDAYWLAVFINVSFLFKSLIIRLVLRRVSGSNKVNNSFAFRFSNFFPKTVSCATQREIVFIGVNAYFKHGYNVMIKDKMLIKFDNEFVVLLLGCCLD